MAELTDPEVRPPDSSKGTRSAHLEEKNRSAEQPGAAKMIPLSVRIWKGALSFPLRPLKTLVGTGRWHHTLHSTRPDPESSERGSGALRTGPAGQLDYVSKMVTA